MELSDSIFGNSFSKAFSEVKESVLDFPSGKTLSKDVWKKTSDGYELSKEAYDKAKEIIEWAVSYMKLKNPKSRIVGSIGSNTYNDSSDIDIHISASNVTKANSDKLNKKVMSEFKKKFVDTKKGSVNGHPFEVYLQYNLHQDEMSVGCYDFDNRKWISGPEILKDDFNPYEEYYDGIQNHLSSLTDDIRMHVLKCGEIASVIQKIDGNVEKNDKFLKRMFNDLSDGTVKARVLFNEIRRKRSVASDPKSTKGAKEKRTSREWKIADSSFKFLDKLGYIAALLSISKAGEEKGIAATKLAEDVISSIHDNLFNKDRTGYADINKD